MTSDDWLGLRDALVVVAGAGGLGGACVEALSALGVRVVVVDVDTQALRGLDERLSKVVKVQELDLTNESATQMCIANLERDFGPISGAVHAVGINDRRPVLDISLEQWRRTLQINLDTAYNLFRSVGGSMVRRQSGALVAISSVSGHLAHLHHGPYAASKGAMNQMVRVMAREWAASGVRVNAVAPGYVETALTREYLERDQHRESLEALVPMGRLGVPSEITGASLFLLSEQARFITGQVIYVDGGRTLV